MMVKKRILLYAGAAALGAGVSAWAVSKYLREKREAAEYLGEGSVLIHTARGPVEAAVQGKGPAVLVLHGAGGGYDQGLIATDPLADEGFEVISISRPGYLRTPLETGETTKEQADACAALLDELEIEKVAIAGISAGGPPSIQFALHYPERCWGLLLISAVNANHPYTYIPLHEQLAYAGVSHADFPLWMFLKAPILPLLGGPRVKDQRKMSPEALERLRVIANSIFPMSMRSEGILNDARQIQHLDDFPLEKIKAPTLVIHGDADRLVPFSHGQRSAERIPNAEFLHIPGGSHLCYITHIEETEPVALKFLQEHAPQE
jgi:pimeloyl-ACP methyl ester carboxylesterase